MTGRACGAHAGRLMAQRRRGRAGVAVGPGMLRRASTRAVQMGFFTRLDGIPEPPSGYIPPEGASRNTWANIYKNKGRIDYCVQQFGVSSAPPCLHAAWSAWVSCGRLRSTSSGAPVVTRPEQGTGRLSVGLNTSRKWTGLVGHFSLCTGVNLPGWTWHFARVSNASFRRGHAMQCGGFQLSISSDWIRQWLTYTILFGADKTMCVRSTCRTASSALTSSRAAPSSSRGRCGVLGF